MCLKAGRTQDSQRRGSYLGKSGPGGGGSYWGKSGPKVGGLFSYTLWSFWPGGGGYGPEKLYTC